MLEVLQQCCDGLVCYYPSYLINTYSKMRRLPVIIFISICFSISYVQTRVAADPIPVFVSIVPQHYFLQQIGKDLVDVQVMVQL